MSRPRNPQGRAWSTKPRGHCTLPDLHTRPVPTTHLVKWPWLGLRRLSFEPVRMRAYTCADHAARLKQRHPQVRVYRYRVLPSERALRVARKAALRRIAEALGIPRWHLGNSPGWPGTGPNHWSWWEDPRRQWDGEWCLRTQEGAQCQDVI